jgi:hypothetical protein|tara:strand:+ start:444 stop:665 length:222 start_codon:yes stop_codon:yes gene_type:complete
MHNIKYDPSMEKLKQGTKVGVVGESHIWDGPLDQNGRPHGVGSSSGITGMEILKYPTPYKAGPITQKAKVYKS